MSRGLQGSSTSTKQRSVQKLTRVPSGQHERHDCPAPRQDPVRHRDLRPEQAELRGGHLVQILVKAPGVKKREEQLADLEGQVDLEVEGGWTH